jgi:hypothetical protein
LRSTLARFIAAPQREPTVLRGRHSRSSLSLPASHFALRLRGGRYNYNQRSSARSQRLIMSRI